MKKPDCWDNLALLVAAGYTVREAAEQLSVTERVAYGISSQDDFKRQVQDIKTERAEALASLVLTAAQKAIARLEQLVDTAEKDSDCITASRSILQYVIPLSESTELRRRIEDLERRAAEQSATVGDGTVSTDGT